MLNLKFVSQHDHLSLRSKVRQFAILLLKIRGKCRFSRFQSFYICTEWLYNCKANFILRVHTTWFQVVHDLIYYNVLNFWRQIYGVIALLPKRNIQMQQTKAIRFNIIVCSTFVETFVQQGRKLKNL